MATQAYRNWVARGRPFKLARPIDELQAWAHRTGVPVLGTLGNETHLQADEPEDHTPFSTTEWPVALLGDYITAIDLGNVRGLGPAIERQARAGLLPWLKYMNHSGKHLDSRDRDGDGKVWEVTPSPDQHVHLSIRTDWAFRSVGTFNPWGDNDMPLTNEDRVGIWTHDLKDGDGTDPAYKVLLRAAAQAQAASAGVAGVRTDLSAVRSQLAALAARPAVDISVPLLVDALRQVLGSLDAQTVAKLTGQAAGR